MPKLTDIPLNDDTLNMIVAAIHQLVDQDLEYLNLPETNTDMVWTTISLNARAVYKAREMRIIIDVPWDAQETARKFCEVTDSELTPATVADFVTWLAEDQAVEPEQLVLAPEAVRLSYDFMAYFFCAVNEVQKSSPEELLHELTNPTWKQPMHLSTIQRTVLRRMVHQGKLI